MARRTRWLVLAAAGPLILLALAPTRQAAASEIQMIRGHCKRTFVSQLSCLPPAEEIYSSPDSFAVWADSSGTVIEGCADGSWSISWALIETAVFADSIYFRQEADARAGGVLKAEVRVDAQVWFRVPEGQTFNCNYGGELNGADYGVVGTNALASVALSRIEPSGATILQADSVKVVLRPGEGPRFTWHTIFFRRTLTAGEYLFEAHTRAQPAVAGTPVAGLWMWFYEYPKPTAVAPTNWSAVKSMYR